MSKRRRQKSGISRAAGSASALAPGKEAWWQRDDLLVGAVLFLTALAYLNSLSGQFLYDDWYQIERNPAIKSWSFLASVFSHHVWEFANTENMPVSGLYYRPIFNLALLINYQLFGLNPSGWHIVSLLFHLGTTAMVYKLGRLWSLERTVAAMAALIFGLHPIHVETVSWASALPDLMLGFFILTGLVFYEIFRASPRGGERYFWLCIACAFLAVGTKETGIMLPLFLIVRESLSRGKRGERSAKFQVSVLRLGAFVGVAVIYLGTRYAVLGSITKLDPVGAKYSVWQWILTVPFIVVQYLRTLIAPYSLAFIYNYEFVLSASDVRFWANAVVVTGLTAIVIRYSSSKALKAFALFIVFLLPAVNLRSLPPMESIAHDRYLYLPSAGFFLFAVFGLSSLAQRSGKYGKTALASCAALAVPILGTMTYLQNQTWRSDTALTEHAIQLAPDWPFLHLHLGEVYDDHDRLTEAENELKRVSILAPEWALGYATLGNFYSKHGRTQEAELAFQEATRRGSTEITTSVNLAGNQIKLGKLSEAKKILERVLARHPENSAANYNLGLVYEKEGRLDLAEQHYLRVITRNPEQVDARVNLAAVLVRQNRFDQAMEQVRVVRSLAPNNSDILYSLAGIYLQSQQCDLAAGTLDQLAQAQPNQPRVYVMMGLSYECLGQLEKARVSFQRAIEVGPVDPITEVARRRLEQIAPP